MRGLDERVSLALARIALVANPGDENVDMGEIYFAAELLGYHDYAAGLAEAPVMFRDEPVLLQGWENGRQFAFDLEEMANCVSCQDSSLPMCPTHG